MKNYPDDMNWNAFDRTWGDASPAGQAWDGHANQLIDVINRAYADYPLNAPIRAEMISVAMDKAETSMKHFVGISNEDKLRMFIDYHGAFEANSLHDKESVRQHVGDWMFAFQRAIERSAA